ncbi:RING-H2 finger protein ATL5H [Zea mays]|uniref:RING-H2 finger protein ATL5H n=2 Tax=Zea mays TaxID=4577 RepID=A0A1D6FRJ5_MAIZE|nr:RING-H2 finger protein ATL5H [Zea mays]
MGGGGRGGGGGGGGGRRRRGGRGGGGGGGGSGGGARGNAPTPGPQQGAPWPTFHHPWSGRISMWSFQGPGSEAHPPTAMFDGAQPGFTSPPGYASRPCPPTSTSAFGFYRITSSESGMRSATSAAVASAVSSVVHSAEGPVKGSELVASVPISAEMPKGRMDTLVPSAPYLPDVERLILGLLLLPAVPMKPGSGDCAMCREFLPTEVLLILPVCSHMFHQSCIITWLCRTTPPCCPFCRASITIPGCNKTKVDPSFCSVEYDIESQMLMPIPPGEVVAEAVGGSHGWLRSSLDRLSGSWRICSSNRATPAVVPVSSRRTTGSWSHGNDSDCSKVQKPLPVPDGKEVPEEVRRSIGWLGSLATLSGSWSGCSSSCSSEMGLMVTLRHVKETLTSSGHSETDKWSMRWDLEAATPTPERPSLYGYARWFFRSSGKLNCRLTFPS